MSQEEADWKTLRRLHPIALDRFCEGILKEIDGVSRDTRKTSHERYTAIYQLIQRRDREIADAFDDMRRSRAFDRILHIYSRGLLTEEEFSRFGEGMRNAVRGIVDREKNERGEPPHPSGNDQSFAN